MSVCLRSLLDAVSEPANLVVWPCDWLMRTSDGWEISMSAVVKESVVLGETGIVADGPVVVVSGSNTGQKLSRWRPKSQ